MIATISPTSISGTITAPPSKSHAQRAVALAALARGESILSGIGASDDVQSALRIIHAMGAKVSSSGIVATINGGQKQMDYIWDCGESGLCLRMFSAIAGLYNHEITLTAKNSLSTRPVEFMADSFEQLGVRFSSNGGFPPISIQGPYRNTLATLDGSVSSQFLTGLLIALPLTTRDTTLQVLNLKSRPYIDLTIATIREFGAEISDKHEGQYLIRGNQKYQPAEINIQGDWSGVAFLFVAAAIRGEITICGLPSSLAQADGKILDALHLCGAIVEMTSDGVKVSNNDLRPFELDCTHCPDLFPPLVALAAHCHGASMIHGVHRLKSKESDRGAVLIQEFEKLGIRITSSADTLHVHGGPVNGSHTSSHGDHRIAMSLSIAALNATSPVTIHDAECVAKSYPEFFNDLASLGVPVEQTEF